MASQIEIINMALAYLGQPPTDTLNANSARENVRRLLVFADAARDWVAGLADWLHLQLQVSVAPLSLPDGFRGPLAYAYPLPSQYLRVSRVSTGREGTDPARYGAPGPAWRVGLYDPANGEAVRAVLWSEALLREFWVILRPDWSLLPPHLVRLVALRLASEAAVSVSPDNAGRIRNDLEGQLRLATLEASAHDGISASAPQSLYAPHDTSGAHVWSDYRF